MNLTQMLVTQRNVDELSQKFGLSEEQTLEVMGALIPAFSQGLKQQTRNPQGAMGLIEALASGHHGAYVEEPSTAVSKAGLADGNAILGHLFGNKDVSRSVADQASQSTGVSSFVIKNMLPAIASMVMGSLFKGATGQQSNISGGQAGGGLLGGLLGTLIEGLAGGALSGARQGTRRRRSRRRRSGNGIEDLLGDLLGGGTAQRSRRRAPRRQPTRRRRTSQTGLESIFDDLLGGGTRKRTKQRSSVPPQRRTRRRTRYDDVFGDMLEPGDPYVRDQRSSGGSVFDEFLRE